MAKLPPKKAEENTGEWLNTYADMVTLLLTFFVLLFACSNLDETKLQFIFQAFKSHGKYINQAVTKQDPSAENEGGTTDNGDNPGGEGTMPQSYEELYSYLSEKFDMLNISDNVAIEQGAAHLTLRFDNSVFFDGDSYILKQEGREVLREIAPGIHAIDNSIDKMIVVGHTSEGISYQNDYTLSSLRACSVVNFLDQIPIGGQVGTIDGSKYRVEGDGKNNPLYDNSTAEGRAKNRRVEITIVKNELDLTDPEVIKDILEHDFGIPLENYDPNDQTPDDYKNLPEGSVDKIVGFIEDKFEGTAQSVGTYGPAAVDGSQFIAVEESEEEE